MVLTEEHSLPKISELTVDEINLSTSSLRAASFHLGKACEKENNEFMLCRNETGDPRACVKEGKAVTSCSMNFFRQLKNTCYKEFENFANCVDKSSGDFSFAPCRNTQAVYDKCVKDNMGIERPYYGYYCLVKVHDSKRTKPETPIAVYPDATPALPDDYPRTPAKYGSRFHWNN